MASGDVVFQQTAMDVYRSSVEIGDPTWAFRVSLNKGGTTANTRQELQLVIGHNSPTDTPFDITKKYNVVITEY